MTGPVTVTQADREAAVEHFKFVQSRIKSPLSAKTLESTVSEMLSGRWDRDESVQAFARARIEGARMALEAAAKVAEERAITQRALERPEDWPEGAWNARQVGICNALELTATAIRQTDPAQIVKGQPNDR